MSRLIVGLVCYITAQACALLDGALAHYLGPRGMSTSQIAFVNALATAVLVVCLCGRSLSAVFASARPLAQLGRGLLAFGAAWLLIYALTHLPFADVSALVRTRPLWMVLLSAAVLGEAVSGQRWLATGVGLVGAVVTVWPSFTAWQPGYLLAIVGVVASAANVVASGWLARFDRTETTLAYFAAVTLVITAPSLLAPLPWALWPAMVAIGVANAAGFWATQHAVRLVDVSLLAPYDNVRLLLAIVVGIVVFGELPALHVSIGAAIIAAATILLFIRERRAAAA